jgi:phosphohistidine phosphatase
MKLLVVRHGTAMEREDFAGTGESDDLRPLTDEGKAEMKLIAAGLRSEVATLDVLATSPLLRARQTAEIIADAYEFRDAQVIDSLVPGAPFDEFVGWSAGLGETKVVAVVGHEPHLGTLVTWLLAGGNQSRIRLKKGGACLVEFDAVPQRDSGILNWLLTPRQLVRG